MSLPLAQAYHVPIYRCPRGHVFEEALDMFDDMPGYTFGPDMTVVPHNGQGAPVLSCLKEVLLDSRSGFTELCSMDALLMELDEVEEATARLGGLPALEQLWATRPRRASSPA